MRWLGLGWPNGEKLASTCVQIWSRPKWAQVIASQRKCTQFWPNEVASWPKSSTCVSIWPGLYDMILTNDKIFHSLIDIPWFSFDHSTNIRHKCFLMPVESPQVLQKKNLQLKFKKGQFPLWDSPARNDGSASIHPVRDSCRRFSQNEMAIIPLSVTLRLMQWLSWRKHWTLVSELIFLFPKISLMVLWRCKKKSYNDRGLELLTSVFKRAVL